jgi:DNA polymerase I-like protein with 3'-5' exonuclease and polymerase domains
MGLRGPDADLRAGAAAASFLEALPGVKRWVAGVEAAARRDAGVRTLAGRTRRLAHILATGRGSGEAQAQARRQAVNTVCQGSAADLAKAAMAGCCAALAGRAGLPPGAARLVLQIHDEFLFEVRRERVREVAGAVRAAMEGAWGGLEVPLRVRLAAGPNWGEMAELEL